jgi:hypothetical protein
VIGPGIRRATRASRHLETADHFWPVGPTAVQRTARGDRWNGEQERCSDHFQIPMRYDVVTAALMTGDGKDRILSLGLCGKTGYVRQPRFLVSTALVSAGQRPAGSVVHVLKY